MNEGYSYDIDISKVLSLFTALSYKEQRKSYKLALRKSANILVREARKNLKRKIGKAATHKGKYGTSLVQGIRSSLARNAKSISVHIMEDYRLKWFELGTRFRFTRHTNAYRGAMKPTYFFKSAIESKKKLMQDSLMKNLSDSINKINNRHK